NVRRVTQGRVICIADACAGASREERALIGRVLEKSRSLGIVSTLDHTDPHRLDLVHDVLDGYDRPARAHVIPDRWQAIEWALRQARPGDAVLIAGSCDASATLAAAHDLPCESDLIRQLLRHTAPHSQQAA
ncbi:MAG: hypothetical protein KDA41_17535, partial [Planctomycetales bacterium]|nr:hypothetical protein [Planctomycetales bacterium]